MGNCSGYPSAQSQLPTDTTDHDGPTHHRTQNTAANSNININIIPPTTTSQTTPILGQVLGRPMEDVRSSYTFGRELGRGQFGVTYLVTHKDTGEKFACKSIATRKLINKDDIEDVKREVQIMHHLTGHRNIVELKGAYEDRHSVNLVMELCASGSKHQRKISYWVCVLCLLLLCLVDKEDLLFLFLCLCFWVCDFWILILCF